MPVATSLAINADIEKRCQRCEHLRLVNPHRLSSVARACRSAADLKDLTHTLKSSAKSTADSPPYDMPRLRHGVHCMVLGVVSMLGGLVSGYLLKGIAITDVVSLAKFVATLAMVLIGVFLLITGHHLRTAEHLPKRLTRGDIDEAIVLVADTKEDQRSCGSSLDEHLSRALLTADAAVLLWLVAPVLLPKAAPIWHLTVVAAGSLLVGKLANEAAAFVAVAIRKGGLLAFHDAKVSEDSVDSKSTAAALRKHYDAAVGGRWPIAPGFWTKYLGVVPGLAFLFMLSGLLLALRLMLASADEDIIAVLIVALLILGTTAVAIELKVRAECLVPAIARAKRIVARFSTGEQYELEMAADRERIRDGLINARKALRSAMAPRTHGGRLTCYEVEDLDLDDPTDSTDETKDVMGIVRPVSAYANSKVPGTAGGRRRHPQAVVAR